MTTILATSSPILSARSEGKTSSESGQNRALEDIDPNYRLSGIQCRTIELALDGLRWSQIARTLNLDPKTLWRWKTHNLDFQLALAGTRADRYDFASERCQTFATRATSVLAKFLDDDSDKNRLRAAQLLLQAAARFKPPQTRRPHSDYPPEPLITPLPTHWQQPELEPKVG